MTKKSTSPMTRITFSVEEADYKALEAMADEEDRSMAWLIRKALKGLLNNKVPKKETQNAHR